MEQSAALVAGGRAQRTTRGGWLFAAVGLFAAGFFLTVLMGVIVFFVRASDCLRAFLVFGGAPGVVIAAVVFTRLAGSPAPRRVGATALALLGTAMIVGATLMLVNALADGGAATLRHAKVAAKSRSKNGHFLALESWLDPGATFDVSISTDRWNATSVGDTIDVATHDGRLGYPWVEKLR